ncbi:hypothetical protein [Kingella sp. (in: b-proteobacteria)]|nr:hypothetical protein [Kingella sp. (in: b-proteobacteria)]MDO4656413.1 hypothetical protein [Kingella sp. (in: b-proteobacteria)]
MRAGLSVYGGSIGQPESVFSNTVLALRIFRLPIRIQTAPPNYNYNTAIG